LTVLGNEFAGEVRRSAGASRPSRSATGCSGFEGSRFGAHAEYLAVPEDGFLATVPAGLTYEEVAPSTEGSLYAQTLIGSAKVRRGYDVLVNGATGAIGSAAVQLLHGLGARVTAVCHGDPRRPGTGAWAPTGSSTTRPRTSSPTTRPYDVVLDAVGKSSFGRCRRLCCGPGACTSRRTWGPLSQNLALPLVTPLLGGRRVRFRSPHARPGAGARSVPELLASGRSGRWSTGPTRWTR
jgi:NADPH:quinone reductase-like Zn-dependent oxidoreductase